MLWRWAYSVAKGGAWFALAGATGCRQPPTQHRAAEATPTVEPPSTAPSQSGSTRAIGMAEVVTAHSATDALRQLAPCRDLPLEQELVSFVGAEIPGRYWLDMQFDRGLEYWVPRKRIRILHHHGSRLELHGVERFAELGLATDTTVQFVVQLQRVDVRKVANQHAWRSTYHADVIEVCDPSATSIGAAWLEPDGALVLQLRAEDGQGSVGDALLRIAPSDPRYDEMQQHVGAPRDGTSVLVRPWPEQQ